MTSFGELVMLNVETLDREMVEETLAMLLKYDRDVEEAVQALPGIMGEEGDPHHDHDHDHGHSHAREHVHNKHKANYFEAR